MIDDRMEMRMRQERGGDLCREVEWVDKRRY